MAKGKFSSEAKEVVLGMEAFFNRSVQKALKAGIEAAVKATHHDSSNAAAHWQVAGANGARSRPWQRGFGVFKDRRGTSTRSPQPPVGYRRSNGAFANATLRYVSEKEKSEVIQKLASGRTPETKFYFYHPAFDGKSEIEAELEAYKERAKLEDAGKAAVEAAFDVLAREFAAGRLRKAYR